MVVLHPLLIGGITPSHCAPAHGLPTLEREWGSGLREACPGSGPNWPGDSGLLIISSFPVCAEETTPAPLQRVKRNPSDTLFSTIPEMEEQARSKEVTGDGGRQ